MPEFIDVFHYVRESHALSRPEPLERFLQGLVAQGYYIFHDEEEEIDKASGSSDFTSLFVPGISQALRQQVERFGQGESDEISFTVYSATRHEAVKGVEYRVRLYSEEDLIRAVMDDIYPDSLPYRHFLNLLELLYNTWHPIYGYQDDGVRPGPELKDARTGNITWLYDINLWGPELVDKMGRERVLKTPAWHITSFEDGGVLIVPEFFYSDGQKEEYAFTVDKAAAYLGLRSEPPDDERD